MEFDEVELGYLRNAVDLFNAHIRAATNPDAPVRRTGERLLTRLWAAMPQQEGDNDAEDADADDRRAGRADG